MIPSAHLDLDALRAVDAAAVIEAWREVASVHRQHVVLAVVGALIVAVFVASLLV